MSATYICNAKWSNRYILKIGDSYPGIRPTDLVVCFTLRCFSEVYSPFMLCQYSYEQLDSQESVEKSFMART